MTESSRPRTVAGRLAPSPTGALHLGNARSFLLAWLSVRARDGWLWCRVEDLDGPRVKDGAAEQALDELQWLGLDWDGEVVVQSKRLPRYEMALDHLRAKGKVYPCVCTRSEIERAQSAPQEPADHGTRYPGTCRDRFATAEAAHAATGRDPAWRLRVPDGASVTFHDAVHGRVTVDVAGELGDFVVAKKDGQPAYQLAVVVDDADFEVSEVLRGDDLLSSTGLQMLLYDELGLRSPSWAHVPLVVGPDGRRLAKRHGDTRVATFRRRGIAPEEIIGWAAWSAGLTRDPERRAARELLEGFSLGALSREPHVLDGDPWLGSTQ